MFDVNFSELFGDPSLVVCVTHSNQKNTVEGTPWGWGLQTTFSGLHRHKFLNATLDGF